MDYYDHIQHIEDFLKGFVNRSENLSAVAAFNLHMKLPTNETNVTVLQRDTTRHVVGSIILITAYAILICISLFGNSIVCYVIMRNRRMYTVTNFFIANMAISDLFVTCLNVPFTIARNVLDEWPFGDFICHLVNFSLMISVYVSTFTLTAIALDRQYVLLYPLKPRITKRTGIVILVLIWVISFFLSLPYGIYTEVTEVSFVSRFVKRCRAVFPEPKAEFEMTLTLTTTIIQYFIPLTIIGFSYGRIVRKLWRRTHLGAVTHSQQRSQNRAKRKSIKLLITVVVIFALCWMPLNLYHILTDFHPDATVFRYDSTVFFVFHWIAISSTCYNPFVYCWMNESFRKECRGEVPREESSNFMRARRFSRFQRASLIQGENISPSILDFQKLPLKQDIVCKN
ncbi:G-protein coupled receptor 83-like isoform X2 [Crassostrea angulata]|uniref:G-protein coupled receptor 83 n=1 Tax=Magallana gigas TaxID=29159 RepID=UPI0022B1BCD6|nr:G-protein coupled receptor 83-like isoform X2 [Crassostrea angulata]